MIPRSDLRWTTPFVLLFAAACSDHGLPLPTATPRARPALSISDGAHGGNAHFFFLPPIVPAPAPTGTFDASVSPEVRICQWNGSSCVVEIAAYSLTSGTGGELVKVDDVAQHYQVNWHTKLFALVLGAQYRIRVLVGNQELGHADVNPVSGGQGLKNVDTGEYIALKDGSTLPIKFRIEVGAVGAGGPVVPTFSTNENQSLAAGQLHTCALAASGSAYCWGDNTWGELGTGATGPVSYAPVPVTGGHKFIALVAMGGATCGLKSSGEAWCWGANNDGQIGIGTSGFPEPTPKLVTGGHTFAALTAGFAQTCGRTTAGEIWCWGSGHLGNGSNTSPTPVKISAPANTTFKLVSAGIGHFCALTTAGDTYCWGSNIGGQLGLGFPFTNRATPTLTAIGHSFESIYALGNHTCGLTAAGEAYCWGDNSFGELGSNSLSIWPEPTPTPVIAGGLTFVRLAGAYHNTCGLTATGALYCWGTNDAGQIGMGFASYDPNEPDWFVLTPVAVVGGNVFSTIDVSQEGVCGVTAGGVAKCWGSNVLGQLGNPDPNNSPSPVTVVGGITWATP